MANKSFNLLRGWTIRVTRLDACGRIDEGPVSALVSDGFISVGITSNITETDAISVTNARGKVCAQSPAESELESHAVTITFCEVNPELYAMLTGNDVEYDANGDAVGFRSSAGRNLSGTGVALEMWSQVPGVACSDEPGSEGSWGYLLLPFLSGGVLGDFTLENNAVTFTIQNMVTKSGGAWGSGPYNVVAGEGGGAAPLAVPMGEKDHLLIRWTSIAPPEPSDDPIPSGPEPTGATAGSPGTWEPTGSYALTDLEALQASSVTASPSTAWATGEYVVLDDGSHAYWDGTAWAAGEAP